MRRCAKSNDARALLLAATLALTATSSFAAVPALAPWGSMQSVSTDFKIPRQWNWSLSLQRELPWWGLFGEVAYVGSKGQHLIRMPNINAPSFEQLAANAAAELDRAKAVVLHHPLELGNRGVGILHRQGRHAAQPAGTRRHHARDAVVQEPRRGEPRLGVEFVLE